MSLSIEERERASTQMARSMERFGVSNHLIGGFTRFFVEGIRPGMFVESVLKNDLMTAVGHGRADVIANLKMIIGFLYAEAPAEAYGNSEKVEAWIQRRGLN